MSGAGDPQGPPAARSRAFAVCATLALGLHALLLMGSDGLRGGADLLPHLRLAQLAIESGPALRNVYAPAHDAFLALLAPALGWEHAVELLAFASAVLLLFGYRAFQRAAGLPDTSAALFALWPYLVALSWCVPKVEAAGYGLALFGLSQLWRGRPWALALLVPATFWVHTASGLLLGLTGGIAAVQRRDGRALAGLAAGALLAVPLPAAHLAAGCSIAEAFLFSQGDYLRSEPLWSLGRWDALLLLSNPLALIAAAPGFRPLWRRDRALAAVTATLLVLYLNELWLAPFARGTTLNLLRGLSLVAVPICSLAGVALEGRMRLRTAVLVLSAVWLVGAVFLSLPRACFVRSFDNAEIARTEVDRCTFRWRLPSPRTGSR